MKTAGGVGINVRAVGFVPMLVIAIVTGLALCMAPDARGAYEQVPEHFGTPEQLYVTTSIAVNHSGVGGVQPGSFYVVGANNRVMRFSAGQEGEKPRLEEQWGWGIAEGVQAYVRCGTAYAGAADPTEHTYEECSSDEDVRGGPEPGHFATLQSVAVDQTTGDVYVLNSANYDRHQDLVEVLTAKGDLVGEGFGDPGDRTSNPPESISEGPENLHVSEGGMSVDASGVVYLLDRDDSAVENHEDRVMSFEPCTAGNYETYCYAAGKDIAIPFGGWKQTSLVGTGSLVIAEQSAIAQYPLGVQSPAPVCSLKVTGQLKALAANESTGEVFWYRETDHRIHLLHACDEATGHWQELQAFEPEPRAPSFSIHALAVNPSLVWGPVRPAGALYAVAYSEAASEPSGQRGYIFAPARAGEAPTVESELTTDTTATSASFTALIDPHRSALTYSFEYLSASDYLIDGERIEGPDLPVTPHRVPASAGQLSTGLPATVTASVSGLSPDTGYVFRVVASTDCNGAGQPSCITVGNAARFATYPQAGGPPDGRGYELVSPSQKNGGEVFPADRTVFSCLTECKPPGAATGAPAYPMQSAPDGNSVAYMGYPFSPTEGAAVFNSYVSRRSADGWQTPTISPALLSTKHGEYLAYSGNLREGIIQQAAPQLSSLAPPGYENLYLQTATEPANLTPLVTTRPPARSPGSWVLKYGGHSADFHVQLFAANDALTQAGPYAPAAPSLNSTEQDLYESHNGQLSLVNVLPGNSAVATGASFASVSPDAHAVSANGRRVFWAAGGHLYIREDGQVTREVQHSGTFLSASEDGLEVLFSDGCLYSLLTEACNDLTQGKAGFLGIAGANADLSRVYFVDTASLSPKAEAGTCERAANGDSQGKEEEKEGKVPPGLGCNLYLDEAGSGTRFLATLSVRDGAGGAQLNDWARSTVEQRTAEASPDGRYLAFASTVRLTGQNNLGPCERSGSNVISIIAAPCAEVFLYDSASGKLVCPSCNPTGEAPLGPSTVRRIANVSRLPQPRYLTDRGRLFFDSQDRLSPRDDNGNIEDVYESEPFGVGSCARASGCISLVSSGTSSVDSNFLAMGGEGTEEGADVFFTTRDRLVPSDKDELFDLYDARENGGFAFESEAPAAECRGEACQASGTPPTLIYPSSQFFGGDGNVKPKKAGKCAKGMVRKKGKCVKQKGPTKHKKRKADGRNRGGAK